ncbi:MAG: hypothetical protein D6727_12430 [Gammaproteobacteria bacterium]|nr:MAG: hypothetical protein D6727_12430 [Gammaproteobacteria bacterium]
MQDLLHWLSGGGTVVTASARQAGQLRWLYDRSRCRAGEAGWLAAPVLPLAGWLEQHWEQAVVEAAPCAGQRLLGDWQTRLIWRAVAADEGADVEPATTGLLAAAAGLAADWGIGSAALSGAAASADEQRFAQLLGAYESRCRALGVSDASRWRWQLAGDLAAGAIRPRSDRILFTGFAYWPPALDRLFEALRQAGLEVARRQPVAGKPSLAKAIYADRRDEQAAAIQWAADQLQGSTERLIGIVLPDAAEQAPRFGRRLLDLLQPDWRARPAREHPVQWRCSESLRHTELVASALRLLALSGDAIDYRELAALLRSRYIAGAEAEAEQRACVDRLLRERAGPRVDHWQWQGRIRAEAPVFGKALSGWLDATQDCPARQSAAAWVRWLGRCLRQVGWPGEAPLGPEDALLHERWTALLDDIAGSDEFSGGLSLAGFRDLLEELAVQRPAQTFRPGGVQILAPEEALGLVYDGLWIAGLHADAWPPPRRPNPLLPLFLQREAGIPEAVPARAAELAAGLLAQLGAAAPQALFSCAMADGELALAPSPLLAELPAERPVLAARPSVQESLYWSAELETVAADPAPAVGEAERVRGGSRVLQLEAACPARAFFELRLGARPLEVPVAGISPQQRGQLLHRAAQALYESLAARGLEAGSAEALAAVAPAVDAAMQTLPVARDGLGRTARQLEARRLERLLRSLLAWDAARPPFRFVAAEAGGELRIGPLTLRLRSDRVDELADGAYLVIDYKTGSGPELSGWRGERPAEPQLPMYALAERGRVAAIAALRFQPGALKVAGVARDPAQLPGLSSVAKFSRGEFDDWEALLAAWAERLQRLAAEFATGACTIDTGKPALAAGQFGPLTRVRDVAGSPAT